MATKTYKNCNSCMWAVLNHACPLLSGPKATQVFELECMNPECENEDEYEITGWADDNLHEGWCDKTADGCPGYEVRL